MGCAAIVGMVAAGPAHGQERDREPDAPPHRTPDAPSGLTSDSVRDAPLPGRSRGTIVEPPAPESSVGRSIARGILWVPRGIFLAVAYPLRAGLYLEQEYRVVTRVRDIFVNDEETLGIYPVLLEQTGFGLSVGGRLFWRNALDHSQALRLRASYGGRFSQLYTARASTGNQLGALRLTASGVLTYRNGELFYGIGNGDEAPPPPAPIPLVPDAPAVETRFRETLVGGRLDFQLLLRRGWLALLTGGFDHYTFSTDDVDLREAENIADVFLLDTVPGFLSDVDLATTTLELRYDTRGPGPLLPPGAIARGALASVFGGYSAGPGGNWEFARYGAEAQLVIDLHAFTRTLTLRGLLDGVMGDYDEIPMVALPRLGGGLLLRGYPVDRFRDRVAALASAEYSWQISGPLYAYLFVDAGRVAGAIDDLSPADLRVGFGGGLHLHGQSGTIARVQLASGLDGGAFLNLVVDNLFDPMWHKERR